MKTIVQYVSKYVRSLNARVFISCSLFIAFAIFCNYYFGINAFINAQPPLLQFTAWFLVFFTAYIFGYIVLPRASKDPLFENPYFLLLLIIAPTLFAWKMMAHFNFKFSQDALENAYWNHVVYWPFKLIVVVVILYFIWKYFNAEQPFYGTATKNFDIKPYLVLLLLMVPLLMLAATQRDFLAVYPKLRNVYYLRGSGMWYHKLLYELSYGTDFFSIELFFRGFLVLAFATWAGKDAILPMALFYCTIHFGKPLGECISSYFGGIILGAVTLQTHSIWGGLTVHLGIAWLMEFFGFLGHHYF